MLPSWGWSQEIFIVDTGPMFSRSISGKAWIFSIKASSLVIAETESE